MNTPHEMHYPIILSRAELAFLLSLLGGTEPISIPGGAFFSEDATERKALFLVGKQQLETRGWLTWQPDENAYHVDDALLAISICIAFPQLVIAMTVERTGEDRRSVTGMIDDNLVIELAQIADQYQINVIASPELLTQRLSTALNLPARQGDGSTVQIDHDAFATLRRGQNCNTGADIPVALAERLATTLRSPLLSATIAFLQIRESAVVATRLVGVLMGHTETWAVTPIGEQQVKLTLIGTNDLPTILAMQIGDLRTVTI